MSTVKSSVGIVTLFRTQLSISVGCRGMTQDNVKGPPGITDVAVHSCPFES